MIQPVLSYKATFDFRLCCGDITAGGTVVCLLCRYRCCALSALGHTALHALQTEISYDVIPGESFNGCAKKHSRSIALTAAR